MAHDHQFDCKICGAHLDSQNDLDKHNREKHTQQASSGSSGSSGSFDSSSGNRDNQSDRNNNR